MILSIKVKPSSGKQEIEKISESEFKVYLKSHPENNKANEELIKLLKKHFGAKEVKIRSGKTSKKKLVEIN
ncbi:MAG: DUF167 domain-containing protein [Nanoarchaeota archaeon]|nr:DUF167 domain-containing protein [Nanoarchaeota archaeon]